MWNGPIMADVSPEGVRLSFRLGNTVDRDSAFAVAWRSCVALSDEAGCLAFPMYDDLPIDTVLDLDAARLAMGIGCEPPLPLWPFRGVPKT